jgi:hypothetical protein
MSYLFTAAKFDQGTMTDSSIPKVDKSTQSNFQTVDDSVLKENLESKDAASIDAQRRLDALDSSPKDFLDRKESSLIPEVRRDCSRSSKEEAAVKTRSQLRERAACFLPASAEPVDSEQALTVVGLAVSTRGDRADNPSRSLSAKDVSSAAEVKVASELEHAVPFPGRDEKVEETNPGDTTGSKFGGANKNLREVSAEVELYHNDTGARLSADAETASVHKISSKRPRVEGMDSLGASTLPGPERLPRQADEAAEDFLVDSPVKPDVGSSKKADQETVPCIPNGMETKTRDDSKSLKALGDIERPRGLLTEPSESAAAQCLSAEPGGEKSNSTEPGLRDLEGPVQQDSLRQKKVWSSILSRLGKPSSAGGTSAQPRASPIHPEHSEAVVEVPDGNVDALKREAVVGALVQSETEWSAEVKTACEENGLGDTVHAHSAKLPGSEGGDAAAACEEISDVPQPIVVTQKEEHGPESDQPGIRLEGEVQRPRDAEQAKNCADGESKRSALQDRLEPTERTDAQTSAAPACNDPAEGERKSETEPKREPTPELTSQKRRKEGENGRSDADLPATRLTAPPERIETAKDEGAKAGCLCGDPPYGLMVSCLKSGDKALGAAK